MASFRINSNRPSSGVLNHGADGNGDQRTFLTDSQGRLVTSSSGQSTSDDNIKSYRSDSNEEEAQISTSQSRLVYMKGVIDPGASDDLRFFIHVLDASSAPSEDTAVDPITTLELTHQNGFHSAFETDPNRTFPLASNGLLVALSTDRFTLDQNNLTGSDVAYFEIDYVE